MPDPTRHHLARLVAPALLLVIVPWGVRQYEMTLRQVPALAAFPMEERRPIVLGAWYRTAEAVRARTRPGDAIDLVVLGNDLRQSGTVVETGLHLRDCRIFSGERAWRQRERLHIHPDPHSSSYPPGPPPGKADLVIAVEWRERLRMRVVDP